MDVSGLVSALLIGVVVGSLGRLALPGHYHIGVLWTLVVGVGAALLGSLVSALLGVGEAAAGDWLEAGIQVALAALGVAAVCRWLTKSMDAT
ncbi:GlsB/YeaQ/YmgE family stress response membrane protein [Streptomyces sp. NPDC048018]|uniref:GlsB/YeaQ/YmgE family stress response membrane protein n=1 Tax=Streptomyces sp. NPDC048018 TaxID=3365499 RepID=UPI00371ACE8E